MTVVTDSLAQLPIFVTFLVIACFWVLIALILLWIGDRFVSADTREVSGNGVRNMLTVAAAFYGFMIGFVVSQEWSNVNDARSQVSQEAAALSNAGFAALTLPYPNSVKLGNALLSFGRSEACEEIPKLRVSTEPSLKTTTALAKLYETASKVSPTSVSSLPGYGSMYGAIGNATSARRQVINAASERAPPVLLIAIVLAGFVLLTAVSLQDVRHGRAHVITVIAVSLFVALGQTLVVTLSRPFAGAATVSVSPLRDGIPAEFQRCKNPATLTDPRQLDPSRLE